MNFALTVRLAEEYRPPTSAPSFPFVALPNSDPKAPTALYRLGSSGMSS